MPSYKAPLDDIRFVLHEVLGTDRIQQLPGYEDVTPDLVDTVLDGMAQVCEEVLFPVNQSGDAIGSTVADGIVTTPPGFKEAYQTFCEAGFTGLACDPAFGGQGLPLTLRFVLDELVCSTNLSFGMFPGLTFGAYEALHAYGSDELKERYLAKLVSGEWAGTMCLTEPHAGTDLGIITTKAVPAGDGAYHVTGSKIFITAGEHDLTENIVHLVLAKLPDAPSGSRGISLLLVPKYLPTEDGKPGTRNGVTCVGIEHKMGIKASPTCQLQFDNAKGWLVGEPHKGLKAMFVMMNGARLNVGMQGLGLSITSYQNALQYAKDRLQMRALTGPAQPQAVADPIIVHPDVRRGLMTMKAFNEGARALAYWIGMEIDIELKHPDAARRQEAEDLVALMTPVIKGFLTDFGFDSTNIGLQTYGGHGYIREYGMEQYVRDARIAQIYEGTNGVQAMDLVGRKLPAEMGRLLRRFFQPTHELIERESTGELRELAEALGQGFRRLQQATQLILGRGLKNPNEAGAAASDYLRMFGLVAVGAMWLRMARVAQDKLTAGAAPDREAFYRSKLVTAKFWLTKVVPQVHGLMAAIHAGGETVMALEPEAF
jgi:alkylation response protein AidB-like acyl-CoA dehydrogenase